MPTMPNTTLDCAPHEAASVLNKDGQSPIIFVCDHASNYIPYHHLQLGLTEAQINDHIGWDIGAAALTERLSQILDAPAILAGYSRLLIDCNRHLEAHDLIPTVSDKILISGNVDISETERAFRLENYYEPFHRAVAEVLDLASATAQTVIAIHSFTPRMNNFDRPWHLGLLFEEEHPLITSMAQKCETFEDIVVGMNAPYDPKDGTYHTMSRHAKPRGLRHAMIEVRNDLLRDETGIELWAQRLSHIITSATYDL